MTVGIFEAKAKLSDLCGRVERRGERIVITRRGRPVAVLAPVESEQRESVWEARDRFVRKHGPFPVLELPKRRKEKLRDPFA
jgi:prevent-host-death family protein